MFSFLHLLFPTLSFTLFQEVSYLPWSDLCYQDIFLIHFFTYFFYLKSLVPINKQFSIDSFLDWEDHHWDFCLSPSSLRRSRGSSDVNLQSTHLFKSPSCFRSLWSLWLLLPWLREGALLILLKIAGTTGYWNHKPRLSW